MKKCFLIVGLFGYSFLQGIPRWLNNKKSSVVEKEKKNSPRTRYVIHNGYKFKPVQKGVVISTETVVL